MTEDANKTETTESKALTTKQAATDQALAIAQAAGIDLATFDMAGSEVIQSGGLTKWVDLRKFMDNPKAGDKEAVAGNGGAFAGVLLSRQEIPVKDTDSGEVRADGVKVRFYYLLRLISPCPVAYKDENKDDVEEVAQPGEIVAIGERNKLMPMRELCEDGGVYAMVIKPHSRIKIGGGHTMWTFDLVKKTLRAPAKLTVLKAGEKVPF